MRKKMTKKDKQIEGLIRALKATRLLHYEVLDERETERHQMLLEREHKVETLFSHVSGRMIQDMGKKIELLTAENVALRMLVNSEFAIDIGNKIIEYIPPLLNGENVGKRERIHAQVLDSRVNQEQP